MLYPRFSFCFTRNLLYWYKDCKNVTRNKNFLQSRLFVNVVFGVSVSWSIINLPGVHFFYFLCLGWTVQGSVFGNIRKALIWENIGIFFNIRARKFRFRKYKEFFSGVDFFIFWRGLGLEVGQIVLNYTTTTSTLGTPCFAKLTKTGCQEQNWSQDFPRSYYRWHEIFSEMILKSSPTNIILHVGTNNSIYDSSSVILNIFLSLKNFIHTELPESNVIWIQWLKISNFKKYLNSLKVDIIGNGNLVS